MCSSVMATYTYQTLIRCKEIRLLEILPGIVSAPVHIDIRHEILDPDSPPQCAALSYAWGSQDSPAMNLAAYQ